MASTGQGVLGNNMFAYCLNNPINRTDLSGCVSIWWYLLVDSDWGYIHRLVQGHIKATPGSNLHTEVTIQNRGRADIVDYNSSSVWEVKHAGINPVARMFLAISQAEGYVGGTYHSDMVITGLGNAGAFSGTFDINVGTSHYEVNYYTPVPGVVLYTVSGEQNGNVNHANAYTYVPHKNRTKDDETNILHGGMPFGINMPLVLPIIPGGGSMLPGFRSHLY